jgi:hypothetical protein
MSKKDMITHPLDDFYLQKTEPLKSCFIALRGVIMAQNTEISTELKYGMPFFCYKGKMFCYLWFHKKYQQAYIGFVEGNSLNQDFFIQEKRSRMKIMLIDPFKDLDLENTKATIQEALNLYIS